MLSVKGLVVGGGLGIMQRGCHLETSGSDVFECRFRLLDYNDVPDVPREKNIVAHDNIKK